MLASGYAANLAAVTALTGPGTLIVSDAGNHASLIDGCRLSRAPTEWSPHADPDAVRKALGGHDGPALVVTDSVFSVDGDAAPLPALAGSAGRRAPDCSSTTRTGSACSARAAAARWTRRGWPGRTTWCAP